MNARKGAHALRLCVEVALAFGAGAAAFTLVAVALAVVNSGFLVFTLGMACVFAVAAMVRFWGVAYAIPALMAALVAFDWYEFPPTHPGGFPSSEDLADLLAYLSVAALVGELAAYAARRAEMSESARSELAEEQAALRRVATLVARGESPHVVFGAVAEETGVLLRVDAARVVRYEGDEVVLLAGWTAPGYDSPTPGRQPIEASPLACQVLRTGRAARIDRYAGADRQSADPAQEGIQSGAGAPIVVDGRLWGALGTWSMHAEPLPDNAEARLAGFTELVATAISNAASRERLAQLADEQAGLLRVATLVARGVPPPELFAAVAQEIGLLLGVDSTNMGRYDPAGAVTDVGRWSRDPDTQLPAGTELALDSTSVAGVVFKTGRPARVDDYSAASGDIVAVARKMGLRSSVGAPIVVDEHLWGVLIVSSIDERALPVDTESRIAAFTRLVATAISNTEARAEVRRLADEQAALRRVATLVARESSPTEVFTKVAEETALILGVETALMQRYEPDGTTTVVANWGALGAAFPIGTHMNLKGDNVTGIVLRTGRPARIDDYDAAAGPLADSLRALGVRSAVGGPLVVDGRLWGAVVAGKLEAELPADSESRIAEFTELVATSISNIQARSELAASRARIVAATDEERRRVVRDLHDGAQQRLVHTVITLKLARRALANEDESGAELVSEALEQAESATAELRELAHGILPAVLTSGGLRAGVRALASRVPVPVEITVPGDRFPAAIEATAYYVVAEALTNVAKHSHAEHATVIAGVADDTLLLEIADDGTGAADPNGHGLLGLADRVASRDGVLQVVGAPGEGTRVIATLPLAD